MLNLISREKINVDEIVIQLLKSLNIHINSTTVISTLHENPSYPSLAAISDSLNEWGIRSNAYKVNLNDYNQNDLIFPFLAHLPENGGRFILVEKIINERVHFSDEKIKGSIEEVEFLKRWDGIALYAEVNESSGEKNYWTNYFVYAFQRLITPTLIFMLSLLCFLILNKQHHSNGYWLLFVVNILGLAINIILLIQNVDSNNPFVQNLCTINGKNNCNSILRSNASRINARLSWSEVGFFYFAGNVLSLLFIPSSIFILALANFLTLPYTCWSIYYQYQQKNWCILCCSIQIVLWLTFVVHLSLFSNALQSIDQVNIVSFLYILMAFFMPIMIWAFMKPFFIKAAQLKPIQSQFKNLKYNTGFFENALIKQAKYLFNENVKPIVLGNVNAQNVITIVSNPLCSPCAHAHKILEKWLSHNDDFSVNLVFATTTNPQDIRTQAAQHMIALSLKLNNIEVRKALNAWYNEKDYKKWAISYPVKVTQEASTILAKQAEWCQFAQIKHTPTVLLNGYKLPNPYQLEDLKYFL